MCDKPWCTCEDVGFREEEIERLRAALAAAEAKLAEVVNRCGLAELAVTQRDIALDDERKHADALAAHLTTALTICSDDLGYEWTHCGDDEPSRALLVVHAARRNAEKETSDDRP